MWNSVVVWPGHGRVTCLPPVVHLVASLDYRSWQVYLVAKQRLFARSDSLVWSFELVCSARLSDDQQQAFRPFVRPSDSGTI